MSRSPLFDIFDPYGTVENGLDLGLSDDPFGVIPVKRKPRVEDLLPPEEKESMLRYLANQGASGLSAIGWLLDTPGSVVRGALSGGPMKGLSALIESSDDRVTGRELARQYGLVGDKDNWSNFALGLGAEVALDPLSYFSLGTSALLGRAAKTTAGRLAERSGMMADDLGLAAQRLAERTGQQNFGRSQLLRRSPEELLSVMDPASAARARAKFRELAGDNADELLSSRMTASNRLSFPGMQDRAFDLYGERGGDAIARAADYLGDSARSLPYIGGITRSAEAIFRPRVMGFTDEPGQTFGRKLTDAEARSLRARQRRLSGATVDAQRNIGADVFASEPFQDAFANYMEGQVSQVPDEFRRLLEPGGGANKLVRAAQRWKKEALENASARGIPLEDSSRLPNEIAWFFRQRAKIDNPTFAPNFGPKPGRQYDSGNAMASVVGGSPARRDYTRGLPRWVMNKMAKDGTLQDQLRKAPNGEEVRNIIDSWVQTNAAPFLADAGGVSSIFEFMNKGADEFDPADLASAAGVQAADAAQKKIDSAYTDLADTLRGLPLEHSTKGVPFYGNPINDLSQYVVSRGRNEATADVLYDELTSAARLVGRSASSIPGGTNYTVKEALEKFGLDVSDRAIDPATNLPRPSAAEQAFIERLGRQGQLVDARDLQNMSLPKREIDEMARRIMSSRAPQEARPLLGAIDRFTQRFKQLALLWPARYTRDAYSGSFAAATQDAFSPVDAFRGQRIGSGVYDSIPKALRNTPEYQALNTPGRINSFRSAMDRIGHPLANGSDEEILNEMVIRKFLKESGGMGLTSASVLDDLGRGSSSLQMRETAPGMAGKTSRGLLDLMKSRPVPWNLYSTTPNTNWLLEAGNRAAKTTDDANRIGTYLNRVRKGDAPEQAKAVSDLTQVVYAPSAYTSFERDVLKRIFPFYSYTKGITPLIAKELLERPQGLTGQSIRAVNRASEPTPDRHVPEYLRQSAAVPLEGVPLLGINTPGISRFLTNIDLPHEGVLNLLTPGLGNTLSGKVGDAIMKTGQNILGQSNPLIKGGLEYLLNRQFFTGRQLSDLYSMLEHDFGPIGRPAEQVLSNAPGGSRVLGTIRQLRDDRISMPERLAKFGVNALLGVKIQDVDQERTARLAARTTLNQLLDQAQGIHTYENLFIKPEDLMKLSEQEQRQYLLYRTLQSEAARKSRERKKRLEMDDPLGMLGVG